MLFKVMLLAAAGAAGTLARFGLQLAVDRWLFPPTRVAHADSAVSLPFPWGVVAVNALGCFAFGLVFGFTDVRTHLSPTTRLILFTGFLGAFTTFSTFAHDTVHLARGGSLGMAVAHLALQNLAGVTLAAVGFVIGSRLMGID
ncbi:MAG: fluoride efflux transporter FluC [Phycisphaeraceae bacterium]